MLLNGNLRQTKSRVCWYGRHRDRQSKRRGLLIMVDVRPSIEQMAVTRPVSVRNAVLTIQTAWVSWRDLMPLEAVWTCQPGLNSLPGTRPRCDVTSYRAFQFARRQCRARQVNPPMHFSPVDYRPTRFAVSGNGITLSGAMTSNDLAFVFGQQSKGVVAFGVL